MVRKPSAAAAISQERRQETSQNASGANSGGDIDQKLSRLQDMLRMAKQNWLQQIIFIKVNQSIIPVTKQEIDKAFTHAWLLFLEQAQFNLLLLSELHHIGHCLQYLLLGAVPSLGRSKLHKLIVDQSSINQVLLRLVFFFSLELNLVQLSFEVIILSTHNRHLFKEGLFFLQLLI